jgi:cytochrome c peroxidase
MRRHLLLAAPALLLVLAADRLRAGDPETVALKAPLGIDQIALDKAVASEPLTKAKIELGKQLYFDGRLSKDGTISCASCHDPKHGWGDDDKFSKGVGGHLGGRHAPTVVNRVFGRLQFWDGRAGSLEDQALGPIQNPVEMANTLDAVVTFLNQTEGYKKQFEAVFGGPATKERLAKAIASFERTVLSGASRVDLDEEAERWKKADDEDLSAEKKEIKKAALAAAAKAPLTDSERRGKALFFGKANCSLCHTGHNYTDEEFYNIGIGSQAKEPDAGRSAISKDDKDWGKFKTPTTRALVGREPYMHDGSEATLEAVVDYYDKGGTPNKNLSERIKPLHLTAEEKADLVGFLRALSGETTMAEKPHLP